MKILCVNRKQTFTLAIAERARVRIMWHISDTSSISFMSHYEISKHDR